MFLVTVNGEVKEWTLLEWALYDIDTRGKGVEWRMEYVNDE